jgi:hypothetical protein
METKRSCSKDSGQESQRRPYDVLKEEAKRLSKGKTKREDKEKDQVINQIGFLCRSSTFTEDQYSLKSSTILDPGTASLIRKRRKHGAGALYSSSKFALRYPPIRSGGSPTSSVSVILIDPTRFFGNLGPIIKAVVITLIVKRHIPCLGRFLTKEYNCQKLVIQRT